MVARVFADRIQSIRYQRVCCFYAMKDKNVDTELQALQCRFGILAEISGVQEVASYDLA